MKRSVQTLIITEDMGKMDPGSAILDITASGRYFRTSRLESVTLIFKSSGRDAQNELQRIDWISEKEEDEYDILTELAAALDSITKVITFNGHSFDLPHLRNKYALYGLMDPLTGRQFRDLFLEYKNLYTIFGLPSRRLKDYASFISTSYEFEDDPLQTLRILSMDSYEQLLNGQYRFEEGRVSDGHLIYVLRSESAFPKNCSIHDNGIHLSFSGDTCLISMPLYDGRIRFYHDDIRNYSYLPLEGYAIHNSMAEYVDKSRKEKAVRENCFHFIQYHDQLLADTADTGRLIQSVLTFIRSR